jgi:uroporphyrinogen decarboxylase
MLDFTVNSAEAWEKAKKLMTLDEDRIPWKQLKENYARWRDEGHWISAGFWFGFDVAHSWMMGTETMLVAMLEEPEFVTDVFDTYLHSCEVLFGKIWDAGYHFDEIYWPDDMGYKGTTFFSPKLYRSLLQPYHKRAVDWAHERGIYAHLHSCGNIMTLLPDVVATGIDALNPIEVKAGMDVLRIKREYGDRIVLHGGTNAQTWRDTEVILAEIDEKLPILKEGGGYIFSSDHSIPNDVSLDTMRRIVERVKQAGAY